jgi:periplasmic mercuric ion binding protein
MTSFIKSIFILSLIITCSACGNKSTTTATEAATEKTAPAIATSQFKVWGNCEQCKETIEGSLKVDGVIKADWNMDTKQVHVTYDEHKISLDQLQKNVAAVGYDNAVYKGDDKAYAGLPECCQYERK